MKDQKIPSPSMLAVLFLSWFYTGTISKAPGTVGSLATLPLIYLLHYFGVTLYGLWALIAALYFLAVTVTHRVQKKYGLHDPQWIVIDEVIGMLITWSFVMSVEYHVLFLVFGLFRIFDIIKIWPASYFDNLHHGIGTITDDVISALYAGTLVKVIIHFVG